MKYEKGEWNIWAIGLSSTGGFINGYMHIEQVLNQEISVFRPIVFFTALHPAKKYASLVWLFSLMDNIGLF